MIPSGHYLMRPLLNVGPEVRRVWLQMMPKLPLSPDSSLRSERQCGQFAGVEVRSRALEAATKAVEDLALDLNVLWADVDRVHGDVGGLEADPVALEVDLLKRRLLPVL